MRNVARPGTPDYVVFLMVEASIIATIPQMSVWQRRRSSWRGIGD